MQQHVTVIGNMHICPLSVADRKPGGTAVVLFKGRTYYHTVLDYRTQSNPYTSMSSQQFDGNLIRSALTGGLQARRPCAML